jgi:prepilin-type N-terminal cleavage/methylation domain-containing protein
MHNPYVKKHSAGFTLIELLVVIAIIGILASIVLVSLSSARGKSRDAARIADVKALKTAMELYYSDNNGYPTSNSTTNGAVLLSDAVLIGKLVPKYIGSMPALLISDGDGYYGGGATTGFATQYGLRIKQESGVYCKTGVSLTDMATNGWWGTPPVCNF